MEQETEMRLPSKEDRVEKKIELYNWQRNQLEQRFIVAGAMGLWAHGPMERDFGLSPANGGD